MNEDKPGLGRGERAPDFVLPLLTGTPTRFYALAGGRPTALIFWEGHQVDDLLCFTTGLGDSVPILVVKHGEADGVPAGDPAWHGLAFPVFSDVEGKLRTRYRLKNEDESAVFLLDPNLRVLESFSLKDATTDSGAAATILDTAAFKAEPIEIAIQTPVLLIPNVLDSEICQYLIRVWENHGSVETGVQQSEGGARMDALRPDQKRRRDHVVLDQALLKRLTSTIGAHVMPEVRKSFVFKATRFEGFKIVCYDAAAGGFFHAHRDNLSPSTAHRRFALTVNLNQDYDGGHLRFPEYGPHLYRPEAGSALVFSCSHLHEVTKVTKGRRFAVLSFLFGEADARASQSKGGALKPTN